MDKETARILGRFLADIDTHGKFIRWVTSNMQQPAPSLDNMTADQAEEAYMKARQQLGAIVRGEIDAKHDQS